jgi:hypothetical protein|tara:strand:+ start:11566 stop:13485 length:1920 start_codon:yes stop_codon:yes gene_type:complete
VLALKNFFSEIETVVCLVCIWTVCGVANAEQPSGDATESYSPVVSIDYPINVYWGDTHVHTSFSTGDANLNGGNYVSPTIAYHFARGEEVVAINGMRLRLRRPLDFLVIADHAENLGIAADLRSRQPALLAAPGGEALLARFQTYLADGGRLAVRGKELGEAYERSVWQRVVERADAYNDPGRFTAFAGYEWSSLGTIAGVFGNLHRVVVFRDDADKTGSIVPFGADDSSQPEDLWAFLAEYEQRTGGQVMAIPHNANLSNGQMFSLTDSREQPITKAYADIRSRFEILMEVTQIKGDSESHPLLSPTDEFADFETWDSWGGRSFTPEEHPCCRALPAGDPMQRKQGEYARAALKNGLDRLDALGVNPFKFGLIGSTDTHSSFSTADSDNYFGKYSVDFPSKQRMFNSRSKGWPTPFWNMSPAGYAGVWAEENTREAIFAAMKRKEVYASTGPRITVRFFGGWSYKSADAEVPDLARRGYRKGVPMGGDLTNAPDRSNPSFLIGAVKDPDGANLDRLQIIKGWRDSDGRLKEKVYTVAASDGRKISRSGKVKSVGSTVNVADASYTNAIGDPELRVTWEDPDFDADELAFYYVRVLEIPTPRWTAYDAKYFDIENIPDEIPMVSQERAYTSPIWYTPAQ